MDLKVGDRIRVINNWIFNREKIKNGDVGVITGISGTSYTMEINGIEQRIYLGDASQFIEKIKKDVTKVIFRENATILIKDNGKKYVTKCSEEDVYDKEKGILLCLAKAHGYKYSDIQELLNNSIEQTQTPKAKKKIAKEIPNEVEIAEHKCYYKTDLVDFFKNRERKIAIHCKTENQAIELLKSFSILGRKWYTGDSYLSKTLWEEFRENSCYTNYGLISDIEYLEKTNCIIYEFEEVDLHR